MLSTLRFVLLFFITIPFLTQTSIAQCPGNVLSNPGFENGETDWSIQGSASISQDANSGSSALEIGMDGSRIYQTHPASPGQIFTLDASWKKLDFFGDANLGFKFLTGAYVPLEFHLATLDVASGFVNIETIVATAPPQTAFIEITAHSNASSSAIIVDDFCLTVEGNGSGQKPDLVVTNLRAEEIVEAGGDWDLTFDLGNIGAITAFGSIEVGIYISEDQNLSADDILFGTETYSNIPVGGEDDLTALLTLPSLLNDGDYFVIIKVDNLDVLNEENENNNTNLKALEIGMGGINPAPCEIEASVLPGSITCFDNNTPDNSFDDLWSFDIRPTNINPDAVGWRTEFNGFTFTGAYNVTRTLSGFLIADGAINLKIEDQENQNCSKTIGIVNPPSSCSNGTTPICSIEAAVIPGSITCDDNNTPNEPSDDTWSLDLRPLNTDPDASGWRAEINGLTFTGTYGATRTLSGFLISDGAVEVNIEDQNDPDCNKNIGTVNPPLPCSMITPPSCAIEAAVISGSISCDDNDTPNEPADDTWSFDLRPLNTDPDASGWRTEINGLTFTGTYGATRTLSGFLISDGAVEVNIEDQNDPDCNKNIGTINPPLPCSTITPPSCAIEATVLPGSITCDDNDTPNEPADDTWSFDIRPLNTDPNATGWRAEINGLTFTGTYGATRTLSGFLISDGAIEVRIEDQNDPDCNKNIGLINPPAPCSNGTTNPCGIEASIISGSIKCYNRSTPDNPNDDYWSFDIRPTNSDPDAVGWRADFNGLSFTGVYGATYTLAGFIIADGPIDVKIQDKNDVTCIKTIGNVIPPPTCSNSTPPPAPDCDVASDFPWHDWILKVKINEEGLSSGKSTYSDFTNIVFDVPTEEPNDIELTAGFSWENFDEYFRVYIDFNQDEIYGDDEIYFQGMLPAKPNGTEKNKLRVLDFAINPSDVVYGMTTMRVVMSRDDYAGPCEDIPYGEIEDYSVNVVEILNYNPYQTRENFTSEELFVYPNPTNEFININLEEAYEKKGQLVLVNAFGQIVWEKNLEDIEEDIYRLPVEYLISGQYTIFMQVDGSFPKYAKVMVIGEN